MAGGMNSRHGESLAQRVANTRAEQAGHGTQDLHGERPNGWFPGTGTTGVTPEAAPPVRHCWYDGPHGRQAALLLQWRKVGDSYDGRVAVTVPDRGGWTLVEMWVDPGMLSPT